MINKRKNNILIRDFEERDIDSKIKWINDEKNNKFLHYDIPLNKEKTFLWFKNKADNRLDCVIEYEDVPVGLIGLINIDNINSKAEYYISIGRHDLKRKGIATTATELILEYAFNDLKLNKVYLNVDEENEAACRLYEKIGYKIEGLFIKDMLHKGKLINRKRYAIFSDDFLGVNR